MEQYKINSQNDTIELILLAFKELSIGVGISTLCDVKVIKGSYSSTIILTSKGDKEIKHSDFFWLGYFVGRDFAPPCKACERRIQATIQKNKARKNNSDL